MQQELQRLDLEVLESMHREAHVHLHACLRRSSRNEEISAQRQILSELSSAIDNKLRTHLSYSSGLSNSRGTTASWVLHC